MMKRINLDKLVKYLQSQPDIRFALLYGSTAKGKANPLSDLDIAIFFQKDLNQDQMGERQIEITCDLMSLFKINNVDVTILNLASPFLCFQVLKYGKLLKCVEKSEFFFFKSIAIGRYQDIKPMYDLYARAAIRNLQRGPNG